MTKKLSGARFRWINEKLYTTTSEDALHMYQENEGVHVTPRLKLSRTAAMRS